MKRVKVERVEETKQDKQGEEVFRPKHVCETCEFWGAISQTWMGECRRFPPTLVVRGKHHSRAWPPTDPDDYCGEWSDEMTEAEHRKSDQAWMDRELKGKLF